MTSAETPPSLQALVERFVSLSERDARTILRLVDSRDLPDGWGGAPDRVKEAAVRRALSSLSEAELAFVVEFLSSEKRTLIEALTDFFVTQPGLEVDKVLRLVGSEKVTPASWGDFSEFERAAILAQILIRLPDDQLALLVEFMPGNEKEPVEVSAPVSAHASEEGPVEVPAPVSVQASEEAPMFDGPVFVVHGRSRAVLHELVRVLERGTSRDVIVLHEQANAGRTILEKFEDYAGQVSFAVVLLTGDDEGGLRTSDDTHLRGRQNVIFELGFFFGKLGRKRVAVLLEENVERPSDIDGLVYISLDQAGAWKYNLARELEIAGIAVNRGRIP